MDGLGATESAVALLCGGLLGVLAVRLGVGVAVAWAVAVVRGIRGSAAVVTPRLARRCLAALAGLAAPLLAQASAASVTLAPDTVHARTLPMPTGDHRSAPRPVVASGGNYVVVRGDTLWDIARRHLPRSATDLEIAREWPRWYAANRAVIGSDPDHLVPGTRLRVPGNRATGTSPDAHPPSAALRAATSLDPDRR